MIFLDEKLEKILDDRLNLLIEKHGFEKARIIVLEWFQEEGAELFVDISHFKRGRIDSEKIVEEIVDSLMVLCSMRKFFSDEKMNLMFEEKIYKMEKKIEDFYNED